ncbi:MAG: hypothetical protein HMLIMOIP_000363 [Candidatus Nitrosomirales archaeon]
MVLEDFLFPQEVVQYQSKHNIKYSGDDYVLYITNRRVIGHKRMGLILKKDKVFSVALEEVSNLRYEEQGLISKKGILTIETKTQKIPFEGKVEDVKVVWREMQKFLQYRAGVGAPTAYTKPSERSSGSSATEKNAPETTDDTIKVLKMRLAKGEISEEEFLRLKNTIAES